MACIACMASLGIALALSHGQRDKAVKETINWRRWFMVFGLSINTQARLVTGMGSVSSELIASTTPYRIP
jgi:hypothetical protein